MIFALLYSTSFAKYDVFYVICLFLFINSYPHVADVFIKVIRKLLLNIILLL